MTSDYLKSEQNKSSGRNNSFKKQTPKSVGGRRGGKPFSQANILSLEDNMRGLMGT
jgi:hypothetical protein